MEGIGQIGFWKFKIDGMVFPVVGWLGHFFDEFQPSFPVRHHSPE